MNIQQITDWLNAQQGSGLTALVVAGVLFAERVGKALKSVQTPSTYDLRQKLAALIFPEGKVVVDHFVHTVSTRTEIPTDWTITASTASVTQAPPAS